MQEELMLIYEQSIKSAVTPFHCHGHSAFIGITVKVLIRLVVSMSGYYWCNPRSQDGARELDRTFWDVIFCYCIPGRLSVTPQKVMY